MFCCHSRCKETLFAFFLLFFFLSSFPHIWKEKNIWKRQAISPETKSVLFYILHWRLCNVCCNPGERRVKNDFPVRFFSLLFFFFAMCCFCYGFLLFFILLYKLRVRLSIHKTWQRNCLFIETINRFVKRNDKQRFLMPMKIAFSHSTSPLYRLDTSILGLCPVLLLLLLKKLEQFDTRQS